jgi:Cellulase (glycosyl hydrolase family 5)
MHLPHSLFRLLLMTLVSTLASSQSGIVVFHENGFPSADSAAAPDSVLRSALSGAEFVGAGELKQRLESAKLLVLAYGSAFPEESWPEIYAFLQRGGNLLVLGGRPFTRAAYRDGGTWKLRDYSVRYPRPLRIDQYQGTPGSEDLRFQSNPDIPLALPAFTWKRGFSPILHLSAVDVYQRQGSAGSIDSNLDALAWGTKDGRRMSTPVIQIDHFRNGFDGGRWIFVDAELALDLYSSAAAGELISKLAEQATRGAEEFTVRPVLPLYLPGEPIELQTQWKAFNDQPAAVNVSIASENEMNSAANSISRALSVTLTSSIGTGGQFQPLPLPRVLSFTAPEQKGLHFVTAQLLVGGKVRKTYRSAFWIRDLDYLRSGPRLGVNKDYFELDGKPLAVMGTTYMSSEVQRLYFDHPNVYVWDRDLRQIHDAGLNMIRTGWWTGWDKFCDENGVPYERTLRTLEAYLMSARKYDLPVQFNFFAFLPEVLGGENPYLDLEAVHKQKTLITSVAARFHDIPFLAYDLINEPSFSKQLWTMRPNRDRIETAKWNEWLDAHYPNREALAAAWSVPMMAVRDTVPLPEEIDFAPRGMYDGRNSLKIYDYEMFAQDGFAHWVRIMREGIRATGSEQLITVGQDEGGFQDRLSPAFFAPYVDFTTNHSWWQNDSILWDSLVAKQPGKAMLIQETGLQRELNLDETSRRTPENEADLFERKVAMSLVQGSGAIEWLWNTNSYMTEGNETPIGALRADGTEKPEATIMRNFATFAVQIKDHLRNPEPAQVAVIASQAAQYSALAQLQIEAQRKAVRALAYYARLTPYVIYENQIEHMGSPKLAILPSPQALTEKAWRTLLKYVDGGGTLFITGPVDRDEHWQRVKRTIAIIPEAHVIPLTYHNAYVEPQDAAPLASLARLYQSPLSFDLEAQSWLESLRFGALGFKELPRGQGRIFWAAEPVELAEGDQPSADLYSYLAGRIGLKPLFELKQPLSPSVMVYPVSLEDSVLYIVVSDGGRDSQVRLRDGSTGTALAFNLLAEHAAMALIGKKGKAVIAKYGF